MNKNRLGSWLAGHLRVAPDSPDRAHVAGIQRRYGHARARIAAPRCRKVLEEVHWAAPVAQREQSPIVEAAIELPLDASSSRHHHCSALCSCRVPQRSAWHANENDASIELR